MIEPAFHSANIVKTILPDYSFISKKTMNQSTNFFLAGTLKRQTGQKIWYFKESYGLHQKTNMVCIKNKPKTILVPVKL